MLDESKLKRGELKALSCILVKMQEEKNDGIGSDAVRNIAKTLKHGDVRKAKKMCHSSSEELLLYPDIRRVIHDLIEPIGYWDLDKGRIVYSEED